MRRWKQGLAWAGFGLAALAVATDRSALVWAAISLLSLALAVRVLERIQARRSASPRDSLSESRDA
jgi:membrane protein implicated in regulation of membrane protease activity